MTPPSILVVDDDFLIRLNTAQILEDAGFNVIEARDAASALDLLGQRSDIRLVCTDVQMPGELDGIELALRIRELHPKMGIIVMSAYCKHCERLPQAPFLSKPFEARRLIDLAREAIGALAC